MYLVDVGDAFAEIELGVFDAVAAFDFDKGGVWGGVAFAACVRDMFASNVEPRHVSLSIIWESLTGVVPLALRWFVGDGEVGDVPLLLLIVGKFSSHEVHGV